MRKRLEKFFALLHGFVTKKLSRHLTVVVACFALLPFGVTVAVGLVGALKGFEFARDFLLSDKIEAEQRSLGNHLALQSSLIEERIGDISFEAKLLALEASGMLGRPEGYPLPEESLLPRIDTETKMALTPKESGISIRLPAPNREVAHWPWHRA